jgi:hypothetical protein
MNRQKKQLLGCALSLLMVFAVGDAGSGSFGWHPENVPEWRLIHFFGNDQVAQLKPYEMALIDGGVGLGCTFIGFGIGLLNPWVGVGVGWGCDTGISY